MKLGPFNIVNDNPAEDGLTISQKIDKRGDVYSFSLSHGTDISEEYYEEEKLIIVQEGMITLYSSSLAVTLKSGDAIITRKKSSFGVKAERSAVYTQIEGRRNIMVNEKINAGEVFALKNLIPYRDNSIVNMDVIHSSTMKFVVMAFDENTALSEHAAPGDAIIFALEGEGIIGYEGKEYRIKEGDNFRFEKNGRHSVKAVTRFKMALLLSLD